MFFDIKSEKIIQIKQHGCLRDKLQVSSFSLNDNLLNYQFSNSFISQLKLKT